MSNKNPSATKKGPGRYHKQGYRHKSKSSVPGRNPLLKNSKGYWKEV